MEPSDVDRDLAPSRDVENSCLTRLVASDERGVLGTVFWNGGCLGSPWRIIGGNSEIRVTTTYRWEHPQCFV